MYAEATTTDTQNEEEEEEMEDKSIATIYVEMGPLDMCKPTIWPTGQWYNLPSP
jgi:hypothetical protein